MGGKAEKLHANRILRLTNEKRFPVSLRA
jgi:hypothetical protein